MEVGICRFNVTSMSRKAWRSQLRMLKKTEVVFEGQWDFQTTEPSIKWAQQAGKKHEVVLMKL